MVAKQHSKTDSELVTSYIETLDPAFADIMKAVRQLVLKTDKNLAEYIKWNVPSFYYAGNMKPFDPKEHQRDLMVSNFRQKNHVLFVLPSGAKVNDTSGLLEGNYTDGRRLIKIYSVEDFKKKEKALQNIIKKWLQLIER